MRFLMLLAFAFSTAIPAAAADWGDLKMRFVYDGEPPQPKLFKAGANGDISDESLVVNPRDRGVQNVFVWLFPVRDEPLEVHPAYAPTAAGKVAMKITAGKLVPRVAIVRTSQTIVFQNADTAGYNVKCDMFNNKLLSSLLASGGSASATFTAEENLPAHLTSVIQPWLVGYLLIRDNPCFAVSDEHGRLTINNIPTGKRTFIIWHEKAGFVKKAIRDVLPVEWPRGRLMLDIKPGDNDLGDIKLLPEQFEK